MKTKPILKFLLIISILLEFGALPAQNLTYNIAEYGLKNGYDLGVVKTMFESDNGLIWLGTNKGLVRFDGHDFKFWNKNDHELLYEIGQIKQDDSGLMWIFNSDRFDVLFFDPDAERFIDKQDIFGNDFPTGYLAQCSLL